MLPTILCQSDNLYCVLSQAMDFAGVIRNLLLSFLYCFCSITIIYAQDSQQSPETEQMMNNARQFLQRGNLKDAITTYKQAIVLVPGKTILYEQLGNALYLNGTFKEAEGVLQQATANADCGEESYRLLAASREQLGNKKGAKIALNKGISRFPSSGSLYNELGNEYSSEQKEEQALNAWIDGIAKAPAFADNYYKAASLYLSSNRPLWGLLYGEIFLYMAHDATEDDSLKKRMYAGYRTLFDNIGTNQKQQVKNRNSFEEAVLATYSQLTPVISDGVSTENLTMVRTRFLMDWFTAYGKKYPFSLFTYQDELIRGGHFDLSNQWLFGKAESERDNAAWNLFHEGDMSRYNKWQAAHRLAPEATDAYNDKDMNGLFNKMK